MGLYLTVFDGDEELDGVEIGGYADFGCFRDCVVAHVENGAPGSRCPTLILHSDCDGQWTADEAARMEKELEVVANCFRELPPVELKSRWQVLVAEARTLEMRSLYDCFFDVDGEPLIERLMSLARLSRETGLPMLLQ